MPLSKEQKPVLSKSGKAGLTLPASRIHRCFKARLTHPVKRIGGSAPIYATAVLEYLTAEVLELAANATRSAKRTRMSPDDIASALRSDPELAMLTHGVSMHSGDKIGKVSKALQPPPLAPSGSKKKEDSGAK